MILLLGRGCGFGSNLEETAQLDDDFEDLRLDFEVFCLIFVFGLVFVLTLTFGVVEDLIGEISISKLYKW